MRCTRRRECEYRKRGGTREKSGSGRSPDHPCSRSSLSASISTRSASTNTHEFAKPVEENDAVKTLREGGGGAAKSFLPISFYEKDGKRLFNTVAILDADGTNLGIYRKTHIPDDHYYQEKFYSTPGDTGFKGI